MSWPLKLNGVALKLKSLETDVIIKSNIRVYIKECWNHVTFKNSSDQFIWRPPCTVVNMRPVKQVRVVSMQSLFLKSILKHAEIQ